MTEVKNVDRARRREIAEARLTRSRPAREASAAAHAKLMLGQAEKPDKVATQRSVDANAALSSGEAKVLEAAGDILILKGGEGRTLAEQIQHYIAVHGGG